MWVNEGLAEYFGDGVVIKNSMKVGFATYERLLSVQRAIESGQAVDFDELLEITPDQWHANMYDETVGHLQYAQSWSVVHLLIHGDGGSYRKPFEQYLRMVSKGRSSSSAFRVAFRTQDTTAFRKRWEKYVTELKPDPLTTALARMKFLARAIPSMMEALPNVEPTLENLKKAMTERKIKLRIAPGVEMDAADEAVFTYTHPTGTPRPFPFIKSNDPPLPPTIRAVGLNPEPNLVWAADNDGKPAYHIQYK